MEAAYVLADKGYRVQLIEIGDHLGGKARAAAVLNEKKEFKGVMEYLEKQLRKLNVEIELKKELNLERMKESCFDEIILAIGSIPVLPKISVRNKYRFEWQPMCS